MNQWQKAVLISGCCVLLAIALFPPHNGISGTTLVSAGHYFFLDPPDEATVWQNTHTNARGDITKSGPILESLQMNPGRLLNESLIVIAITGILVGLAGFGWPKMSRKKADD